MIVPLVIRIIEPLFHARQRSETGRTSCIPQPFSRLHGVYHLSLLHSIPVGCSAEQVKSPSSPRSDLLVDLLVDRAIRRLGHTVLAGFAVDGYISTRYRLASTHSISLHSPNPPKFQHMPHQCPKAREEKESEKKKHTIINLALNPRARDGWVLGRSPLCGVGVLGALRGEGAVFGFGGFLVGAAGDDLLDGVHVVFGGLVVWWVGGWVCVCLVGGVVMYEVVEGNG